MLDNRLVKRRKKKILTGVIGGISGVIVTAFIVIAFLGQYVGTFTVAVSNHTKSEISLYDNDSFQNPTTFLRVGDLPEIAMYSALKLNDHEKIDNTDYGFEYGAKLNKEGNPKLLYFLKYSFYVANTGNELVDYTFQVRVLENNHPTNTTYDLLTLARLRVYSNVGKTDHEYRTFAQESSESYTDEEGNLTNNKPIAGEPGTVKYCGFAEPFEDNWVLMSEDVYAFAPNEYRRYTVVFWFEGEDKNSDGLQPQDCSLKLGVEITGYETVEEK